MWTPAEPAPGQSFVDISRSHGLGPAPIEGRESHTSDMARFEARMEDVRAFARKASDSPLHEGFWEFLRGVLAPCVSTVGYRAEADATTAIPKVPSDIQGLGARVGQLGLVNPINPAMLSAACGLPLNLVLMELLVATRVGMMRMRWAPECVRCGSAVLVTESLGSLPGASDCSGCGMPNRIHSLDKVMVTFTFAPDVLYVLANNYACTPSTRSMGFNAAFAPMAATNTGSGFRYSFGTGTGSLGESLAPGRYRMHCPVSMTDNFLEVGRAATEHDEALVVPYHISEMVVSSGSQERKVLSVEHGRIHFDIFPDTRSFFVLWIQQDVDEETLLFLPDDERSPFVSAATVMLHPAFSMFEDQLVPGGSGVLDVADVHFVFTDVVGSTDLYAELGDGNALGIVHTYFEALFGAFSSKGRIVKTIGDAVMAAFPTGAAALEAATEGLRAVRSRCVNPNTGRPLEIRLGIHRGSTLVVPVNGINDYFGQTVNIAARVEGAALPSQCLVSETVLADADAQRVFHEVADSGDFEATAVRPLQLRGVKRALSVRGLSLR